ncbi:hypothetical protein GF339_18810 [candidate division KSB3 bacterium]|uniref:DUF4399 domain-containing protein n=1 Tax=candidate division KSB3 bacterium TaxID=2044937 RepID=A0A9D5JYK3_9BACT|nr:hypothetical protein [candidate division KSB3 bacterium]MBD3326642.1 hypothetical protein [candidate division KSB3 bacterium]
MPTFKVLVTLLVVPLLALAGCATDGMHRESSHQEEEHGHSHAAGTEHEHGYAPLEIPENMAVPEVEIEVIKDPAGGWNLHVVTQNFRFAPENSGGESILGEGHAHLYINGPKYARLYGQWFHIPELPPGENTIEVTLNANDHREYAVNGEPISASVTVTVAPQ